MKGNKVLTWSDAKDSPPPECRCVLVKAEGPGGKIDTFTAYLAGPNEWRSNFPTPGGRERLHDAYKVVEWAYFDGPDLASIPVLKNTAR